MEMKVKRASSLNVLVELNATKARSESSQRAILSLIKQELFCHQNVAMIELKA